MENDNSVEYLEYCRRKLYHYNEWLMDTKREFGVPYPGFIEDLDPTIQIEIPPEVVFAGRKSTGIKLTKKRKKA